MLKLSSGTSSRKKPDENGGVFPPTQAELRKELIITSLSLLPAASKQVKSCIVSPHYSCTAAVLAYENTDPPNAAGAELGTFASLVHTWYSRSFLS